MSEKDRVKQVEQNQAQRFDEAVARAHELEAQDNLSEAELTIRRANCDIYGGIAIAEMYRARLRRLVNNGEKQKAIEAFHLAKTAAWSTTPEAHTAIEAEKYEAAYQERVAELIKILGFDPGENLGPKSGEAK